MEFKQDTKLEDLTGRELAEIRAELRRVGKKTPYVKPGIQLSGYLPAEYKTILQECVEYAAETHLIAKPTRHKFVTWAVKQLISNISYQKRQSKLNSALELNQDYSE